MYLFISNIWSITMYMITYNAITNQIMNILITKRENKLNNNFK